MSRSVSPILTFENYWLLIILKIGRNDEHMDKKIELVSRGFNSEFTGPYCIASTNWFLVYEVPEPSSDERVEELENENEQLRRRLAALERQMNAQSPTRKPRSKKVAPSPSSNILGRESDIENAIQRMNKLNLADSIFAPASPTASPGKKQRKLTTRKWDLAPEHEI